MKRGLFLFKLRNKKGISQIDIANELGYSSQLVSQWEKDKGIPDLSVIGKYASILGIDLEGFIKCKESKRNTNSDNYSFNTKSFSNYLKSLRKQKNITQEQLAKKLGIPAKAVIRFEQGISLPSLDTFIKLCKYYHLSYDELYFANQPGFSNENTYQAKRKRVLIPVLISSIAVAISLTGLGVGLGLTLKNKSSNKVIFVDDPGSGDNDNTGDDNPSTGGGSNPVVTTGDMKFGIYPSSHVSDPELIAALNQINSPNSYGYYEYNNRFYAKRIANMSGAENVTNYFMDGTQVVDNQTYWFNVESIKWDILSETEDTYTLISTDIIDASTFDDNSNNYKESNMRSWLNDYFYNHAFIEDKDKILLTHIDNSASSNIYQGNNPYYCDDTDDYVYLASAVEIQSQVGKAKVVSDYSRTRDIAIYNSNYGCYWLRTPDSVGTKALYVLAIKYNGAFSMAYEYYYTIGIRPVITIRK